MLEIKEKKEKKEKRYICEAKMEYIQGEIKISEVRIFGILVYKAILNFEGYDF